MADYETDLDAQVEQLLENKENEIMDLVVQNYKHPSYDAASKLVLDKYGPSAYAEYSTTAHLEIDKMIKSKFNRDTCHSAGDTIGKMGGLQAMQQVYYAMLALLGNQMAPLWTSFNVTQEDMKTFVGVVRSLVDLSWHGLHGWEK